MDQEKDPEASTSEGQEDLTGARALIILGSIRLLPTLVRSSVYLCAHRAGTRNEEPPKFTSGMLILFAYKHVPYSRGEMQQMTSKPSVSGNSILAGRRDFSLVLGGPLFQLLRRAHLADDALMLAQRRIVVISLICWLPLLLLSAFEGQLLGGRATVPFLFDVEAHVRFLVAIPLLVASELVVHRRMLPMVKQFLERRLIPDSEMKRFDTAIESGMRLRNSVIAEVFLIAFVYIVGVTFIWRQFIALDAATWYATPTVEGTQLSLAGMWYGYVSLPFFQFLLGRWYFRLFVWARFLWAVSRIDLRLVPTHPDRVGGLGFLSQSVYAFALLAVAHGALVAGALANRILYIGTTLPEFVLEIAAVVALVLCVALGPLLVFAPQLARTKRIGLSEYGTLAERYVRDFDTKWLRGGAPPNEPLVGSGDVQSLADLANSFEVVRTMRIAPFTKESVLQLALATLAPIAPLLLSMMPLEELLKKLFGILL